MSLQRCQTHTSIQLIILLDKVDKSPHRILNLRQNPSSITKEAKDNK